jgi:hypothetical protein
VANSPAHRFGPIIGGLLEEIIEASFKNKEKAIAFLRYVEQGAAA